MQSAYTLIFVRKFRKQMKKLARSGSFDVNKVTPVLEALAHGQELGGIYRDHELKGDMAGHRECHIMGNIIMVYEVFEPLKEITLLEIGSHPEIFG